MDCGTCFSKYLLCLFNFVILVAGTGVLVFGVWLYADKESLLSVANAIDDKALPQLEFFTEPEMSAYISYVLMAVGGAMFILSILGYCGALRESRCLLGFYGFLLILILILEITAAGMAYFYKDKAEDEVRTLLKTTITSYYSPDNAQENPQTQFLNLIMIKMHCCGVDNYDDFKDSPRFNQSGYVVPPACCFFQDINGNKTLLDPDCPKSPKPENSYFMTGCYETIMQQIKDHMDIVIYVVVGLVVIELLSTFLAFCLCKSLQPFNK